jgi:hypothetical protein
VPVRVLNDECTADTFITLLLFEEGYNLMENGHV